MPCLEISMPAASEETRTRLAESLTAAFAKHSGFPADIFGIRFLEYDLGQAASGGKLCTEGDERPYLHMLLYAPRLKRALKQQLAAALSAEFVEGVGKAAWMPVIHICEHPHDNVAVGGKLLSEAYPELAEQPFYYSTADAAQEPGA